MRRGLSVSDQISFKLEAPCDNDDDMLSACDARQFVPAGRLYMSHHPGASQGRHRDGTDVDANQPLVKALRNISLTDDAHVSICTRSGQTFRHDYYNSISMARWTNQTIII